MKNIAKGREIGLVSLTVLLVLFFAGCFFFQEKAEAYELELRDREGLSIPWAKVRIRDSLGKEIFFGNSAEDGIVRFSAKAGKAHLFVEEEYVRYEGEIVLETKQTAFEIRIIEEIDKTKGGLVWRSVKGVPEPFLYLPSKTKVVLLCGSGITEAEGVFWKIPGQDAEKGNAYLWFTPKPKEEPQLVVLSAIWSMDEKRESSIYRIEIYSEEGERLYRKGDPITEETKKERSYIPSSELRRAGDISSTGGQSSVSDGIIDVWDLIYLLNRYNTENLMADLGRLGSTVVVPPQGPFSHNLDVAGPDNKVDVWDLILLLNAYGATVERINTPFAPINVGVYSLGGDQYGITWEMPFPNDYQEEFYLYALDATEGFVPTVDHAARVGVVEKEVRETMVETDKPYLAISAWNNAATSNLEKYFSSPVFLFIEGFNPEMVLVEGGTFQMGDEIGDIKEGVNPRPTHTVTFTYDYWIGKYEVTFGEYDAYCEATGLSKPNDAGWGRGDRPVIYANWWDSIAYCNWLSDQEGFARAYDLNGNLQDNSGKITTDITKVEGYRLPTEAEWEYAASGGHRAIPIPPRYKYAGSDQIEEVSWYEGNSGGKTQPVGRKAPNELGIFDMSGNVNEWCHDWLGDYTSSNKTNPIGPVVGTVRALRGGSYGHSATRSRVAYRSSSTPDYRWVRIGFRIAKTVIPYESMDKTPPTAGIPEINLSATTTTRR